MIAVERLSTAVRTVQVTMDCPWPTISGGHIRDAFIASSAALLGPVRVISLGSPNQAAAPPGISVVQPPGFAGKNPWHQREAEVRTEIALSDADLEFMASQIRSFNPGVAIFEGVYFARAQPVFEKAGVPVVLDMHNIESDLYRYVKQQESWVKYVKDALYGSWRWRSLRALDRTLSLAVNETWVVSALDRARLLQIGGTGAIVIGNPIPDERMFSLALDEARYQRPRALFIGHLAYPPNVAAVRDLALKVWPIVKTRQSGAQLTIAGRSPSRTVKNLCSAHDITLLPSPGDLIELARHSGYSLLLIHHGGGTRIKALEAMAAGLIVIATAKAVEGLCLRPGEHYLAAESPREFARQLEQCCADPAATAAMATHARAHVKKTYGSEILHTQIHERLLALMGSKTGTAQELGA